MRTRPSAWGRARSLVAPALLLLSAVAVAGDGLVQVHEDFSKDPGWEAINNRVVGVGGPMVRQDFGWSPGEDGRGAVGGEIWSTTTPATYGMPVGPFDLTRRLSASGKVAIKRMSARSGAYFGFYNSTRQGWRPWSSMMLEFGKLRPKFALKPIGPGPAAAVNLIVLPADWRSDGVSHDLRIPADGKPHAWSFVYEPKARTAGGKVRSQITVQVDGEKPYRGLPEVADLSEHPAVMDRFGIVNNQTYGDNMEVYFSDLMVNGHKVDLTRDPRWVGQGNRAAYPAWSFHGRHDYGFVETNWAGRGPGELGGLLWSTEMPDPTYGYYADDIGRLRQGLQRRRPARLGDAVRLLQHAGAQDEGLQGAAGSIHGAVRRRPQFRGQDLDGLLRPSKGPGQDTPGPAPVSARPPTAPIRVQV